MSSWCDGGAHCQPDRIWDHLGDKLPATPMRNHLVFAHARERSGNKYLVKRWLFKNEGDSFLRRTHDPIKLSLHMFN